MAEPTGQEPTEREWSLADLITDNGAGNYHPRTADPIDPAETAYDGVSVHPPPRDLTARERDVLCRLLRHAARDPRFAHEETHTYAVIAAVIDPRRGAW